MGREGRERHRDREAVREERDRGGERERQRPACLGGKR